MSGPRRKALIPLVSLVVIIVAVIIVWPRGEVRYARMSIGLYPGDTAEELASPGAVESGQRVTVLERHGPWARVKADAAEGWIPLWYLVEQAGETLPQAAESRLVVKGLCQVHLYPDVAAPAIRGLERGKVVTVRAELGEWRYVDITVFDIPSVQRGWVRAASLAEPGEVQPMEGRLPAGTIVYPVGQKDATDPRDLPSEVLQYGMAIRIQDERGDMVRVSAAGGWEAWVAKRDVVFDVTVK